jgi:Zn-dependent protease with chaperone function
MNLKKPLYILCLNNILISFLGNLHKAALRRENEFRADFHSKNIRGDTSMSSLLTKVKGTSHKGERKGVEI